MANCESCIHFNVCEIKKQIAPLSNSVEKLCSDYKDRDLCLDLPCKVGSIIYKICPQNPSIKFGDMLDGRVVTHVCQKCPWQSCACTDIGYHNGFDHIIREFVAKDVLYILLREKYFGRVYFTSYDEAKQFLEKCEGNP